MSMVAQPTQREVVAHPNFTDAAQALAERVVSLIEAKPSAVIGLCAGNTPAPVYAHIASILENRKAEGRPVDVSQVRFVALDEYVGLPPHHPSSFSHQLWQQLLHPIGATAYYVHLPPNTSHNGACQAYEDRLKSLGGADLWIVGIGQNGHIGFNEPGDKRFTFTREVALSPSTLAANANNFTNGTIQPTHAITVGLQTIMKQAKSVALIASGTSKNKALAGLLSDTYTPRNPATTLQFHPHLTVYADTAAMGSLKGFETALRSR